MKKYESIEMGSAVDTIVQAAVSVLARSTDLDIGIIFDKN